MNSSPTWNKLVSGCFSTKPVPEGYGITYFMDDFKAKEQALGNLFKWANVTKILDYEQIEIARKLTRQTAEKGQSTEMEKQEVYQDIDCIMKTL